MDARTVTALRSQAALLQASGQPALAAGIMAQIQAATSGSGDPDVEHQRALRERLEQQQAGGTSWEKFSKDWRNWALVGSGVVAVYLLWRLNK